MRISNIFYFIKQGFLGIIRNAVMSSASILILASSMLVLGTFWTVIANINSYMDSLDELNVILLYISPETDEARTEQIGDEIRAMDNVTNVTFLSKEEAWELELQKYDETQRAIFEQFVKLNPLPDTYKIEFAEIEKSTPLLFQLSSIEGIDLDLKEQGKNPKSVIDIANKVESFKNGIAMICVWLLIILLVVSFFVIMNTIRLTVFSRKQEIIIMRYVGATSSFIVAPFIVEGIIIGVLSSAIAYGLQYYLYTFVMPDMLGSFATTGLLPFSEFSRILAIAFLAVGHFAGIVASSMSMRKYLKA